jgi:hypothetical protein
MLRVTYNLILLICTTMVVGASAGNKHKLFEFGRWIVPGRQGKHHQHRLLKKSNLRGNGNESRRRLLGGSLVLSEEEYVYTIQTRELSFSYSYSQDDSNHLSLADVAASLVVNQTIISNAITMKSNSF